MATGMRSSVISVAMLATAMGACGSEPTQSVSDPVVSVSLTRTPNDSAETSQLAITTLVPISGAPARDDDLGWTVHPVSDPCPEAGGGSGPGAGMNDELARLEPMLGRALAYATGFPDQFASHGLIWHAAGDASVFVAFAGDIDQHRVALAEVVDPDDLIVCQTPTSSADALRLQQHLGLELADTTAVVNASGGRVSVRLAAADEELAAHLDDEYGHAVQLQVGALTYPPVPGESTCAPVPTGAPPAGVAAIALAPVGPVSAIAGESVEVVVALTNTSDAPVVFAAGAAIGHLVDADAQVVNAHPEAVLLNANPVDLAPGATVELAATGRLASCRSDLGYVVPEGHYRLVVEVPVVGAPSFATEPATMSIVGR